MLAVPSRRLKAVLCICYWVFPEVLCFIFLLLIFSLSSPEAVSHHCIVEEKCKVLGLAQALMVLWEAGTQVPQDRAGELV